ncbi:MAG: hypothetical protein PHS97_01890 [Oscillospiraceae bacterium]|nr:hypothetical protein [Oscillospiraceae bacterium]
MKRVLILLLALIMVLGLFGCGAPKTEEPTPTPIEKNGLDTAVSLLEEGEYESALEELKQLEQTDEVRGYIKKASFYILADYIFKIGAKGNYLGESNDADGYYIEESDFIIYVKPTSNDYDCIQFTKYVESENPLQSDSLEYMTLNNNDNTVYYIDSFLAPANFGFYQNIQQQSYTRDTELTFEWQYNTTEPPNISSTKEEVNVSKRDKFNDFLDNITITLRRLDLGITLQDLGFSSFE